MGKGGRINTVCRHGKSVLCAVATLVAKRPTTIEAILNNRTTNCTDTKDRAYKNQIGHYTGFI
jgi:hypothetical protein